MAGCVTTCLLTALLIAVSIQAHAQSLGEPVAARRVMEVGQFGVPRDAKYIFCDGQACPERSTKTVTAPTAPTQASASPVLPLPKQPLKSVADETGQEKGDKQGTRGEPGLKAGRQE